MEILIFLAWVILLAVILKTNHGLQEKVTSLQKKLDTALRKLDLVTQELGQLGSAGLKASEQKTSPSVPPVSTPQTAPQEIEPIFIPVFEERLKEVEEVVEPAKEEQKVPPIQQETKRQVFEQEPTPVVPRPKPIPKPSFFERNPDLEKFIGENLINKIGIAILVVGIGFFVKFAIDQGWIGTIGRVAIGILCGGILLGFAHYLRNTYKPFSSVLVGGGLAVFYFTISIAYQEYHIFDKGPAFGLMVAITAFAILLSIAYDRKELAILAIVGGFSSPFFVSDGSGNYVVMFSYILILNVGMLVLAYFKRWYLVNVVSYVFTILLFAGWVSTKVIGQENAPYWGGLLFATCFYAIFFLMNVINNLKESRQFVASEISILMSNNVLYFSVGMILLKYIEGGVYQGLFTVILGIFNFVFAFVLLKSKKADKNVVYLLIGLVLTFASLAAPVQLEGNYITMFWALEAVLLLWLSQKSGIQIIKVGSFVVMGLMIVSLVMDWEKLYFSYSETTMTFFLNKAFVTSFISLASILASLFLLKKEGEEMLPTFKTSYYQSILSFAFVLLAYFGFLFEFDYQANHLLPHHAEGVLYIGSYNLAFACGLLFWLRKEQDTMSFRFSLVLTGVLLLAYVLYYNGEIEDVRYYALMGETSAFHYFYHYVLAGLVLVLLWVLSKRIFTLYPPKSAGAIPYLWCYAAVLLYLASAELEHLVVYFSYHGEGYEVIYQLQENVFRIGLPILWGVCSFALMYLGMRKKIKTLRIIALVAFAITLLKLFIFDVSRMNEGGKIAAFISLGVLLLIISFMYQKLKKLIIEDDHS